MTDTIVADGFAFPEGPCFDANGVLYLVEMAGGAVSRIIDGRKEIVVSTGGAPNGAAFGPDGLLYFCNNGGHWPAAESTGNEHGLGGLQAAIQRITADGAVEDVVTEIDGTPLNSPNDICFDDAGGFWFTDPRWAPRRDDLSIDMSRVAAGDLGYVDSSGVARRIVTRILFPNGVAVSEDGSRLYVDETATGNVYEFPIDGPGELGDPVLYASLGADAVPDGMAFDVRGRLYVASHGSGRVFVLEDGEVVEEILFDDPEITNVCFGGEGNRTMFVTQCTRGAVARVEREVPGMVLFPAR